jgi:hypothetical protein
VAFLNNNSNYVILLTQKRIIILFKCLLCCASDMVMCQGYNGERFALDERFRQEKRGWLVEIV